MRSRNLWWIAGLLVLAVLFVVALRLQSIWGTPLPRGSRISTLGIDEPGYADLAVDQGDRLHLVWGSPGPTELQANVRYQHSEDRGGTWSDPDTVPMRRAGPIFVCRNTIHILWDPQYEHVCTKDLGRTWELADRIGGIPIQAFGGVGWGDTLVVAFMREDTRDQTMSLEVGRWLGPRLMDQRVLAHFPTGGYTVSRLVEARNDGRAIHVIATFANLLSKPMDYPKGAVTTVHDTRVTHFLTHDGGATWTMENDLPLDTLSKWGMASFAMEALPEGLQLAAVSDRFRVWSLGEGNRSFGVPAYPDQYDVAATHVGSTSALAWIDRRYNWGTWNLRGFLMNPNDAGFIGMEYMNNDVFVATYHGAWAKGSNPSSVYRLTREPAYAGLVRSVMSKQDLFVLWVGRTAVGRHFDAYGAPQRIFLARIPLAGIRRN